jgi:acetyl-CoA carboxylase biotin carboxyl carrier protein
MAKTRTSLDSDMVRELAGLLDETGLTEIEIEQDNFRIRVSRAAAPVAALTTSIAAPPSAEAKPSGAVVPPSPASHPGAVKSPMVGTAYRASAPSTPAFVEVGTTVKQGQTLLIIEAMKTMNQIPSPRAGTIKQILVDNAEPVEFGHPLMIIE